jgi:Rox3 mediator complex subunit
VPLLKTVARTDPVTGEKINKLRKSYEGQIKSFAMSGRNKVKKNYRLPEDASKLRMMAGSGLKENDQDPNSVELPLKTDDEWHREHNSTAIKVTTDFAAKLKHAMQLQPGTVRNLADWDDLLGHDKPKGAAPLPVQNTAPAATQRMSNGVMRPQPRAVQDFKRQTRGKKRSYGDESFTGYGDGYSDVEDAGAIDDYGDDEGGSRRKRRKVSSSYSESQLDY